MWASKTGKAEDTPGMIAGHCLTGRDRLPVHYGVAFGCPEHGDASSPVEGTIFEGAFHDRDR
jgi:hypothetical protein